VDTALGLPGQVKKKRRALEPAVKSTQLSNRSL
jgi:hypothetical protein